MTTQDTAVEDVLNELESGGEDNLDESARSDGQQDLASEQEESSKEIDTEAQAEESGHGEASNLAAVAQERSHYRRQYRRAVARLAELEAVNVLPDEQRVTVPDAKSPIEVFAEQNQDDLDAPIPLSVQLAQQKFDKHRQELMQQAQATNQTRQAMAQSIATAKATMDDDAMGEGLAFDSVVAAGAGYLTESQKAAVRAAGPDAGEVLYNFCLRYAKQADTDEGDRIRAALKPKSASKPSGTTSTKPNQRQEPPPKRREALQDTRRSAPTAAERLGIRWPDEGG